MSMNDKLNIPTDDMAVPYGSLGLLEKQLKKVFFCWDKLYKEIKPYHLIFAADNGIAVEGVVRQPQAITYLQAKNMVAGNATISCFCRYNNIPYKVVDMGINSAESVGYNYKIAKGTKNFLKEPAMTQQEYEKAFSIGKEMVRQAKLEGYNMLSFGEMGIGNTTTSAAVLYSLTHTAPELITGYGANKDYPEVIARKRVVIVKANELYNEKMHTSADIIRYVGGFDIAAMCGAMIECSCCNIPFVLDGFITAVAFACAIQMDYRVSEYALASHLSCEPGMLYALKMGGIHEDDIPIRAQMALGEGTGAVLLVSILRTMMYAAWNTARMSDMETELMKSLM